MRPFDQVGGLFGLMLGFSVVSFNEILYWLSRRLARNCMRKASSDSETELTVAELGNGRKVSGLTKYVHMLGLL